MTVEELREAIKDLPGDMLVGNTGHYGEYLQTWDFYIRKPTDFEKDEVFCISIEDAGEEPD